MEAYDYDTAQLIDEKTIIVQVGRFKFTSGYRASKMIKPRYIKGEIYKNPHFYGRLMKFVMEPNGLENDEQLLEYLNSVGYDGLLNTQGVGVLLATDIFLAYGLELASHSQRLSKPKRVTYQRYLAAWEIVRLWEQQQKRTDRRPDWIKEEIGTFLDPLPIGESLFVVSLMEELKEVEEYVELEISVALPGQDEEQVFTKVSISKRNGRFRLNVGSHVRTDTERILGQ